MLLNNIELDLKVKCIEKKITQASIAKQVGTTPQYINRIIKKGNGVVNDKFLEVCEVLGYDILIKYRNKEKKGE